MMTEAFGGASGGACFAAVTPAYGIDNTMSGKQIIKGTMRSWPRRPRPQMQLRRRAGWTARFDTQARRGPWTSCESSSPPGRRMRARCASNVCSQEDPTLHFYGSQLGKSQGTHPRGRTRTAHNRKKVESRGGASETIWDPLHLAPSGGSPAPGSLASAVFASVGRVRPRSASPGRKSPASSQRRGAASHSHSRSPKRSWSSKKKTVSARCGTVCM
jgi:hypothetical protein